VDLALQIAILAKMDTISLQVHSLALNVQLVQYLPIHRQCQQQRVLLARLD
jgi:hypothetical protein